MDKFFNSIFNAVGKQYEVLVYERSRRTNLVAQRDALKLMREKDDGIDYRLARKIELTETILTALAELKDLQNDTNRP